MKRLQAEAIADEDAALLLLPVQTEAEAKAETDDEETAEDRAAERADERADEKPDERVEDRVEYRAADRTADRAADRAEGTADDQAENMFGVFKAAAEVDGTDPKEGLEELWIRHSEVVVSFDGAEVQVEDSVNSVDLPKTSGKLSAGKGSSFAASANSAGGEYTFRLRRPKFMEERTLTAAERGTVSHLVMQHIPLGGPVDEQLVRDTVAGLQQRSMLSARQAAAVDAAAVAVFFAEPVGKRLLQAEWVRREVPFSCTFQADRVYPDKSGMLGAEPILIQGVIDCLFQDAEGLVLLDYKTDKIYMKQWDKAADRHRFQLSLYAEAVERILGRKVDDCYVFFFDGGQAVKLF
ncbi:PD-(D/E)XK nuclease family protein [Paenibacillus sp. sptzw28]|nr:PD-(D/E)XK nuclease family protein [Paenibacillus sp. sptzw28]